VTITPSSRRRHSILGVVKGFSVVNVLRTSLRVFGSNFVGFLLIALAVYAPVLALRVWFPQGAWELFMVFGGILLNTVIAAAVTYGVIMELHGTRPSLVRCVTIGVSQPFGVLGVVALSALAIVGGLLLLVVPGIVVVLMLYVVVPVAVIERPGVMAALRRSRELTDGYKGALLVIVVALQLGTYGANEMLGDILPVSTFVVEYVVEAIVGVFSAVTAAVAYTLLRQTREGTQVPELATAIVRTR
jgi:hypothetical protein